MPLVSFCISTYKRPQFLKAQLHLLSQQTYTDFEIIISDNDIDESGKNIVECFDDKRFKYYPNKENLGMIKSFNRSIERSSSRYIVMITDDDPLDINFLSDITPLIELYPEKSMYCGFKRYNANEIELIHENLFPIELLNPKKNPSIFWSNCILQKKDVIKIGLIPDYGSPHLSDHALLALTGSVNGAAVKNKIYSSHYLHDSNYSKGNLEMYYKGCTGFYEILTKHFKNHQKNLEIEKSIRHHLYHWFISMSFALRKYFYKKHEKKKVNEVDNFSEKILSLHFMKSILFKYRIKKFVFKVKVILGIL